MAETPSNNIGIVPVLRNTVNKTVTIAGLLSGLMAGLPVKTRACELTLSESITGSEIGAAFDRGNSTERQTMVTLRFWQGDLWNRIQHHQYNAARMEWLAAMKARFPDAATYDKYMGRLRLYGCIASRWPAHKRDTKFSWSHFRDEFPDVLPKRRKEQSTYFLAVRFVKQSDGSYMGYGLATGDKSGEMRFPAELVEHPEETE